MALTKEQWKDRAFGLEAERDRLREALLTMCVQYLEAEGTDGEFVHDFMTAGENACDVLCDLGLATFTPTGCVLTDAGRAALAEGGNDE